MKMKTKIMSLVSAVAVAFVLFAAVPKTVSAEDLTIVSEECYISGPANVQKGGTYQYTHMDKITYSDGYVYEYNVSEEYPTHIGWAVGGATSADTSITPNGYASLTIGADETASSLLIVTYDAYNDNYAYYTVYIDGGSNDDNNGGGNDDNNGEKPGDAGAGASVAAPSDADPFWLGVHQSITAGAKNITVNADGKTFVPFYVLDALREKSATITITCGLDDYIISGLSMKNLRFGANYAFTTLADVLNTKTTTNSRGGVTYTTGK